MSNAASTSDGQDFRQEVLDRMAEQSPALGLPRLIAIDHLHKMTSGARRRLEDSHARQVSHLKQITGVEHDVQPVPSDEEEMISVAGDTVTNHYHGQPPSAAASSLSPLVKYGALPLAAIGLPLIGALLATWWNQPAPAVVPPATQSTDTDTQYYFGIE